MFEGEQFLAALSLAPHRPLFGPRQMKKKLNFGKHVLYFVKQIEGSNQAFFYKFSKPLYIGLFCL